MESSSASPGCLWPGVITPRTGSPAPFPGAQAAWLCPASSLQPHPRPGLSWPSGRLGLHLTTSAHSSATPTVSTLATDPPTGSQSLRISASPVLPLHLTPAAALALSWTCSAGSRAPLGLLSCAPLQPLNAGVPRTPICVACPPSGKTTRCSDCSHHPWSPLDGMCYWGGTQRSQILQSHMETKLQMIPPLPMLWRMPR